MPVLKNARHERFAQELANGKSASEAYQLAGYKPDDGHASRLAGNGKVRERIGEVQARGAKRAEITLESLLDEAADLQRQAKEAKQFAAANGALKLKAELSGHYVQRKEDVTPRRSLRDIDARIAQLLAEGGKARASEPVGGTGAGAFRDEAIPTVLGHGTA